MGRAARGVAREGLRETSRRSALAGPAAFFLGFCYPSGCGNRAKSRSCGHAPGPFGVNDFSPFPA